MRVHLVRLLQLWHLKMCIWSRGCALDAAMLCREGDAATQAVEFPCVLHLVQGFVLTAFIFLPGL